MSQPQTLNRLSPLTADQIGAFLDVVRPPGRGFISVAANGAWQNFPFDTHDEAAALVLKYRENHDIYFTPAAFSATATSRKRKNVELVRALFVDLDCGPNKPFRDPANALEAFATFQRVTSFPDPTATVLSGGGVHLYWVFSHPLKTDTWKSLAERFKAMCMGHRFSIDPTVTADAARILRVPGTWNLKLDSPRPVIWQHRETPDGPTSLIKIETIEVFLTIPAHKSSLSSPHEGQIETCYNACAMPLRKAAFFSGENPSWGMIFNEVPDYIKKIGPSDLTRRLAKEFAYEESDENVSTIRSILTALDADLSYPEWRNVIFALNSLNWTRGKELARTWSASGKKFDEISFNKLWSSAKANDAGGISVATLFHMAKAAQWVRSPKNMRVAATTTASDATAAEQVDIPSGWTRSSTQGVGRLVAPCALDISSEPVEWLVPDSVPLGMLAVVGGNPGLGKSQIALSFAALVTTGRNALYGPDFQDIGSAIILATEDDASRTIRPRLEAAGADLSKVRIVEGVMQSDQSVGHFSIEENLQALRQLVEEIGDVRLIVIDPPAAYLGHRTDAYKESDVRRALAPLVKLAQELRVTVLLVVHLNKRADGDIHQKFSGSTAWVAVPRVAFMVAEDPKDNTRYMLPVKNNLGDDRRGFTYEIEEVLVGAGKKQIKTSRIRWGATTEKRISEIIAASKPVPPSTEEALLFLRSELRNGAQLAKDLKDAALGAGIAWPTVKRAKVMLMIRSEKRATEWWWILPAPSASSNSEEDDDA